MPCLILHCQKFLRIFLDVNLRYNIFRCFKINIYEIWDYRWSWPVPWKILDPKLFEYFMYILWIMIKEKKVMHINCQYLPYEYYSCGLEGLYTFNKYVFHKMSVRKKVSFWELFMSIYLMQQVCRILE